MCEVWVSGCFEKVEYSGLQGSNTTKMERTSRLKDVYRLLSQLIKQRCLIVILRSGCRVGYVPSSSRYCISVIVRVF